jgi:hypothetical protein
MKKPLGSRLRRQHFCQSPITKPIGMVQMMLMIYFRSVAILQAFIKYVALRCNTRLCGSVRKSSARCPTLDFAGQRCRADRDIEEPILAMGRRIYCELLHHGPNCYTCLSALSPRTKLDGAVEWSRTTDLLMTNQLFKTLIHLDARQGRALMDLRHRRQAEPRT